MHRRFFPVLLFGIVASSIDRGPLAAQPSASSYHVAKRIVISGGNADFLTVDPVNRRLYGAYSYIIDIDHDSVVSKLPYLDGYGFEQYGMGFAVAPDLDLGVGRRGVIFRLSSHEVVKRLTLPFGGGDATLYDPSTHRVFLFNDTTSVVDLRTQKVVGKIPLPEHPESGVLDGAGHLYVNLKIPAELVVIDVKSLAVVQRWNLTDCEHPEGLSIDTAHARLFVSCRNKVLMALDSHTGSTVARITTVGQADQSAYDPSTGFFFNANGDGTLTIVHEESPNTYRVAATVPVPDGARALALDTATHRVFLLAFKSDGFDILVVSP